MEVLSKLDGLYTLILFCSLLKTHKKNKTKTTVAYNLSHRPGIHCCWNLSLCLSPFSLNNMSFGAHTSFSTNCRTLGSMQWPSHWTWHICAGTEGLGPDLCVPLHQHVGWLEVWGPGSGDGQGSGRHSGHQEREGDYAIPGLLPKEDEKPGG